LFWYTSRNVLLAFF